MFLNKLSSRSVICLEEANFVTITGYKSNENDYENSTLDYVWATNDQYITGEDGTEIIGIDTDRFTPGISKLVDENILQITKTCKEVNKEAVEKAGEIGANIAKLNAEGAKLALRTDAVSVARRDEIADITTSTYNTA